MYVRFVCVAISAIILAGCASLEDVRDNDPARDAIMADEIPEMGFFAVHTGKTAQRQLREYPTAIKDAMRRLTWKAAHEKAGTFLVFSDRAVPAGWVPTLVIQNQGEIAKSGDCKVVAWEILNNVSDLKGLLATMDGHAGGANYMISLKQFTEKHRGGGAANLDVCPTSDPATVEVYAQHATWLTTPMIRNPDLFVKAGTVKVDLNRTTGWIVEQEAEDHLIIRHSPPPPVEDWWGYFPVPTVRKQELQQ